MHIPEISDIRNAYAKIKNRVNRTPVMTSSNLNSLLGINLFLKCENFQKVGAFKYRGATNAILNLNKKELQNGVATHSSGNHAAALALAARNNDSKAYIVMPQNAPRVKKNAVKSYGAEIVFCEPTLEARESTLKEVVEHTNATFIHPFNNFNVICGQGTAALEFFEEEDNFDFIMAPVGGGGLLSGTAITTKLLSPGTKVIAAEPKGADDAYRSFKSKSFIPSINPNTIADGLLTSLSDLTLEIILNKVDDILTVEEKSIIAAMHLIWERMKIIVEPSSAVPLAAILENQKLFVNKKVGIIISGGNVDLTKLPF